MPIYDAPGNDKARLTFLKRAVVTSLQDQEKGNNYVTQESVEKAQGLIPTLEEELNTVKAKLSTRSTEVGEKDDALKLLETYVRDTWEVLKRRVARQNEPAQVLTYYQLPLSGVVPKPTTREEWLVIAKQVIDGDNKAVEQGFEAMSNPSAAQVDEILVKTQKESDDVAIADREYDKAQEALEELRPTADEAINDIMSDLRYNLRKKDDASQRRIMKTYGATFKYLQGEPEEPEEEETTE